MYVGKLFEGGKNYYENTRKNMAIYKIPHELGKCKLMKLADF
jgi:hypothetical protein